MKTYPRNFFVSFLIILFYISGIAFASDHPAAVNYAKQWASMYNPAYYNYSQGGGREDVNFVSQAFRAGQKFSDNSFLEFYTDDLGMFKSSFEFEYQLDSWEHTESGWTDSLPPLLAEGDIVVFSDPLGGDELAGIVVGVRDDGDYDVAYHTPSTDGTGPAGGIKSMSELILVYGGVSYYHFERASETDKKARFYGTNIYDGPGGMSIKILKPGENYEGYIVKNKNSSEQDMVIATNTSDPVQYPGCSYLISAYCVDPAKDAPSEKQELVDPYTSDSKKHWAYWVRQAILWSNQQGTDSATVLEAVWYIVSADKRFDDVLKQNPVLRGIKFSKTGPVKGGAALRNGSFEDVSLSPWLSVKLQLVKDGSDCSQASEGSCSLRIKGNKKNKYLMQTLALSGNSGDTFVLSADAKAKKPKRRGKYSAELLFLNTDNTSQVCRGKFSSARKKNKKWQSKRKTCVPKKDYQQVSLILRYGKQKGKAYFDNVKLTRNGESLAAAVTLDSSRISSSQKSKHMWWQSRR